MKAVKKKRFSRDSLYRICASSPAPIWQLVFMALPLVAMLMISFWISDSNTLRLIPTFTLENYAKFFASGFYVTLLIKTIKISAISVIMIVLISYPVAYYVAFKIESRVTQIFLLLALFLPFWTSYLVRTFAWMTILGRSGIINTLLLYVGLIHEPISALLYSENTTMLGIVYVWLPFGILPIYSSLSGVDRHLLEASSDLGAGNLRTFWHITLPLSMPGVLASVVILFIPILGSYVEPSLLGGPYGAMIGISLLRQYGAGFMWPFGNAMAFILLATAAGIILVFTRFVKFEKILRF
jgi:spermidine/putrescine transport system permease protein